MKIIRISLNVDGQKFFFDRAYDAAQNDYVNCDAAMKYLVDLQTKQDVLAAMKYMAGRHVQKSDSEETEFDAFYGALPASINLKHVAIIIIENVGVYEQPDSPKVEASAIPVKAEE